VKRALREDGINWWNYGENGGGISPDRTGTYPVDLYTGTQWISTGTGNYTKDLGAYQEGNPEEGITDTAARIKGAFGLLAEIGTPGGPNTGNLNYHRRVRSYEIVCEAIIRAFADKERGPILKKAVDDARMAMALGTSVRKGVSAEDLVIAIRNTNPQPVNVEMPDEPGIPAIRLVRNPASPDQPIISKDFVPASIYRSRYVLAQEESIVPHSTVKRPTAYIINCDTEVAARIAYTGVRIERLVDSVTVPVEYYTVKEFGHQSSGTNRFQYFKNTPFVQSVPNMQLGIVAVNKGTKQMTFKKDTFVVFMNQYNSVHASLTLEPMGARNYGNYWFSRAKSKNKGFLPVALDQDFPAYRFMDKASALKTYLAGDITMLPFVSDTHIEWPLMLTQEEKARFTSEVLSDDIELLAFSSFIVNRYANDFRAYLKNTVKAGDWYAWDWAAEKAVRIIPAGDGYATLITDNIGSGNEVILFKVSEAPITPPGDGGGGSGCNAFGYFALALVGVPFVFKRKCK
jgi:Synergist-CTERM protein sorting domain-containing protein